MAGGQLPLSPHLLIRQEEPLNARPVVEPARMPTVDMVGSFKASAVSCLYTNPPIPPRARMQG